MIHTGSAKVMGALYGCTVLYSVVGECGVWVYCTV